MIGIKTDILRKRRPRSTGAIAVLLVGTFALGVGCSRQPDVPPPSADANDILKNSDGAIGPMKGTPGNP